MKVIVIEIKPYQSKNTWTELNHTWKNIINNLKKFDPWKTQLTIAINFIFFKDTDKERVIHSKSDSIEFMIYDNANEVIKNPFLTTSYCISNLLGNINKRKWS